MRTPHSVSKESAEAEGDDVAPTPADASCCQASGWYRCRQRPKMQALSERRNASSGLFRVALRSLPPGEEGMNGALRRMARAWAESRVCR